MTDKKTDNNNNDFTLNHFDLDPHPEPEPIPETDNRSEQEDHPFLKDKHDANHAAGYSPDDDQSDEALHAQADEQTDDTTDDSSPDTAPYPDLFPEPDQGKKEPIIPDNPGFQDAFDTSENSPTLINNDEVFTADNETGETVSAPPLSDDTATDQRSGIKPITVFAVVAMLGAAAAVWFNPGTENSGNETTPDHPTITEAAHNAPAPAVLHSDSQKTQRLEQQLSSLQQQSNEEINRLKQQVKQLEQEIASMKKLIAEQPKQTRPSSRPAETTVRTVTKKPATSASTSPIRSQTGWVVNLMSLDSLAAAKKALQDFKSKGIDAEIGRYAVKGTTRYRIRVAGFASRQEAETHKKYLIRTYHFKDPWVQKPS